MRQLIAVIISCLLAVPSYGAIGTIATWEVRSTGSAANGGFYTSGGTDWSQQDAAQYAVTDAVTAGTTTITSATANFGTDVIGNGCYVTGGTGSITAARYQVASRTNTTTIVMDRSTGLTAGTGVTLNCGGAVDSTNTANGAVVAGNTVYIKGATYTTAATITLANGSAGLPIQWIGYTTTRTDGGSWTLQSTNNAANPVLSTGNYNTLLHVVIDGNSKTGRGLAVGTGNTIVTDCEIKNVAGADIAFYIPGIAEVTNCYIHANTALNEAVYISSGTAAYLTVSGNTINSGGFTVRVISGGITVSNSIITGNTAVSGTVTGGIYCDATCRLFNNDIHNNAGNGIETTTAGTGISAINNIITSNTGWCERSSAAISESIGDYNACYNNTLGTYSNVIAGAHDITLTGVPYTNAGSGDYSLNNISGQGAACRAAGYTPSFRGISTNAYMDLGAAQHQDSGGGSSQHNSAIAQ